MLLLQARAVKKQFGDRLLFSIDNLTLYSGDKIGVVGRNGAGKTTLLNVLAGEIEPDEGTIDRFCPIAYVRQFGQDDAMATGAAGSGKAGGFDVRAKEGTQKEKTKARKELRVSDKVNQEVVSGGEKTRLKIADAVGAQTPLLLADEPTANLDAEGIAYLTQRLEEADSLLLISHDRALLDGVCNRILEIENGVATLFMGNYTDYAAQKKLLRDQAWFEYDQYREEKQRLEQSLTEKRRQTKSMKKAPSRMGNSEARLHKGSTQERLKKAQQGEGVLAARLDRLDVKEKPREIPPIALDFSLTDPPRNRFVIETDHLHFGYGGTPLLTDVSFRIPAGSKTALIGPNGSGKTTLLRRIREGDRAVRIAPKATLGSFFQEFENLDEEKTVLDNVLRDSVQTATTVRTILARLLIGGDDVYKKVRLLSGGERIKVAFAKLFVSPANVLLLDEPTNYLDIPSIEALQAVLSAYEGTVLFVSHDKAFISAVADRLLLLRDGTTAEFDGTLADYERSAHERRTNRGSAMQETMLRMKMTQLLADMPKVQQQKREALEEEYKRLEAELMRLLGE